VGRTRLSKDSLQTWTNEAVLEAMTLEASLRRLENLRASGKINRDEFRRRKRDVEAQFGSSAGAGPSGGPSSTGGGRKRGRKRNGGGGGAATTLWETSEWADNPLSADKREDGGWMRSPLTDTHEGRKWKLLSLALQVEMAPTVATFEGLFHLGVAMKRPKSATSVTVAAVRGLSTARVFKLSKGVATNTWQIPLPAGLSKEHPTKAVHWAAVGAIEYAASADVMMRCRWRYQYQLMADEDKADVID